MQTYKVETRIPRDGTLKIKGHPFQAGEQVEVVVRVRNGQGFNTEKKYPLRGKPIRYEKPFKGAPEEDWDALG